MTLLDLLNDRVANSKDRLGYVYRGEKISYGEFNERCEAMARSLAAAGIGAGDRFALCLRNSPEFLATWFGLSKLGAIAVHVNFMVSQEEMSYILKDSGAKGVISQQEFAKKTRESSAATNAKLIIWTDGAPAANHERLYKDFVKSAGNAAYKNSSVSEQTPAAILYTSGTTGKPKGAVLSHGNLAQNAKVAIEYLGLKPHKEIVLCILPMFHIFAWTALVLGGLAMAAPLIIVESITPPKPWLKLIAKWKVTLFAAVPPIYHGLAKQAKGFKGLILRYYFFRSVKYAISGAAPLPLDVLQSFESRMGVPILEGYGMTETSPVISVNTPRFRKPGSVGRIIPGVEIKIINEQEQSLPVGEEGEICAKGPNVMLGYYNLPEDTKAAFTKDGYLKTGDIGRLDNEGYLAICDRKKDMIIIKGLKVFPAQVEEVILRHPQVAEAAVVGIPVVGGNEIIKAFVTAKEGAQINKAELQQLVQENLPPYKRPRDIEIRETLPKNALQKILKRELRRETLEKMNANGVKAGLLEIG